eukprot:scaffold42491_cov40-Phaeocystis_antarctica.AAC.1
MALLTCVRVSKSTRISLVRLAPPGSKLGFLGEARATLQRQPPPMARGEVRGQVGVRRAAGG